MTNFMQLKEYSEKAGVTITTLWNWHRRGRIVIMVSKTPRWVIDSAIYPPHRLKRLKRGKAAELYGKSKSA